MTFENYGSNRHEAATIAIMACLDFGINTSKLIVETLVRVGFDAHHARIVLAKGRGTDYARHSWKRNGLGEYSLLGQPAATHPSIN